MPFQPIAIVEADLNAIDVHARERQGSEYDEPLTITFKLTSAPIEDWKKHFVKRWESYNKRWTVTFSEDRLKVRTLCERISNSFVGNLQSAVMAANEDQKRQIINEQREEERKENLRARVRGILKSLDVDK